MQVQCLLFKYYLTAFWRRKQGKNIVDVQFVKNPCIVSYVCLIINITLTDFYSVFGELSPSFIDSFRWSEIIP